MAIIIQPWRIPEEGMEIEGEEPAEVLALEPDGLMQAELTLGVSLTIPGVIEGSHESITILLRPGDAEVVGAVVGHMVSL